MKSIIVCIVIAAVLVPSEATAREKNAEAAAAVYWGYAFCLASKYDDSLHFLEWRPGVVESYEATKGRWRTAQAWEEAKYSENRASGKLSEPCFITYRFFWEYYVSPDLWGEPAKKEGP